MELLLPGVPHQRIGTDNFRVPVNAVLDQKHRLQGPIPKRKPTPGSVLTSCFSFLIPPELPASRPLGSSPDAHCLLPDMFIEVYLSHRNCLR